ncbi:Zn(II)2Cys6 transcription factor domain-containing protein [Aspergillus thermomutatus]|uniref:Zn(2)-C6 fungal-type domain-containing protein n=1 Tax=Aspergillus thermomutatus TaxID=41047 RepID=A0A397GRA2_ASPTH|nr:uncharacterized protein CDV56_106382 [Aspergillus thermomutatus]RHZ53581.1 hypothetical protein CDV56_106382 [Aspergillus thermomutatus]
MGNNSTNFGVLSGFQYIPCSTGSSGRPSFRRACDECRRKKSRCDMLHPQCSLCSRIGSRCTYSARYRLREGEGERDCRRKSVTATNTAKNDRIATDEVDLSLFDLQNLENSVAGLLHSSDGLLGLSPSVDEMTGLNTIPPSAYHFGQDFDQLSVSPDNRYDLLVPPSLEEELINIYFDKVQAFCPLFLRAKFN